MWLGSLWCRTSTATGSSMASTRMAQLTGRQQASSALCAKRRTNLPWKAGRPLLRLGDGSRSGTPIRALTSTAVQAGDRCCMSRTCSICATVTWMVSERPGTGCAPSNPALAGLNVDNQNRQGRPRTGHGLSLADPDRAVSGDPPASAAL